MSYCEAVGICACRYRPPPVAAGVILEGKSKNVHSKQAICSGAFDGAAEVRTPPQDARYAREKFNGES